MQLAWGPITQLYSRNLHHEHYNIVSLNCRVAVGDEALNELFSWKDLPRLKFDSDIWSSTTGLSIKVAMDASDSCRGGHTLSDILFVAHEYISE